MARIFRDAWGVPHVRATSIDGSRARAGTGHRAGPGLAAGVPAPPRDRHHRRGLRTVRASRGTGSPGAPGIADTARRAHARLGGRDARVRGGVRRGRQRRAARRRARSSRRSGSSRRRGRSGPRWRSSTPSTCSSPACPASSGPPAPARCSATTPAALARGSAARAAATRGRSAAPARPPASRSSAATRTAPSRAPASTSRSGSRATSSTWSGFAFPGVPGVPHFAHAGDVAWAITNAMADYQDVYAERLRREGGRVEALGPGRLGAGVARGRDDPGARRPSRARSRSSTTDRGPVFSGSVDEGQRAQPARRVVGAGRPRLRRDPPAAARPHRRRRGPARSTTGSSRSTTWWPPTGTARCATGSPAGCRCATTRNRRGHRRRRRPGEPRWTGWLDPLPRADIAAGRAGGDRQRAARPGERPDRHHVRAAAPRPAACTT